MIYVASFPPNKNHEPQIETLRQGREDPSKIDP